MIDSIILVTSNCKVSGVRSVQMQLIREWIRTGIKVTVLEFVPDGTEPCDYVEGATVESVRLAGSFKVTRFLLKIKTLLLLTEKYPDAAVISLTNPTNILVGFISNIIKNKTVVSERNDPNNYPEGKMQRLMRNISFRFVDKIVFQTRYAMEYFPECVQKKGTVIPNPVDHNLPLRYEGERDKRIVAVGRLKKQKNWPMLIRAFSIFNKERPGYILEIYGEGPDRAEITDLICELGLEQSVVLKGFVNDVTNRINSASMYVSSSDYEGISNSMNESLAMGIPAICTDCPAGGAGEMIQNYKNGVLVPVGRADILSTEMIKMADDPAWAEKLSREAIKIRELYPIEKIAYQWIRDL